ncbi:MAG: L,D-transpeptidase family protein, partial [Planctomycetota bacterium]
FSPRVYPDDSTADTYVVQRGDSLSTIPRQAGFNIDYRLVQRINQISDPRRLGMGQRIKGLYGPFHAVVHKSAFRLDVYTDQRDSAGNRIYIRSFPVGLGEYGSTPIGSWVVAEGKVLNPGWRNPRTGEVFDKDDPLNPIGERWIGLEGTDENTALESGYGIHGTVEPESIGREMSMGCVRMLADDVALMFELLVPGRSTVEIVP